MPSPTKDGQRAFEETVLEDPQLEQLCEDYADSKATAAPANRRYRKAKKGLDKKMGELDLGSRLVAGERIRVGEYVIEGNAIEGGPTNIPEWSSIRYRVEHRLV